MKSKMSRWRTVIRIVWQPSPSRSNRDKQDFRRFKRKTNDSRMFCLYCWTTWIWDLAYYGNPVMKTRDMVSLPKGPQLRTAFYGTDSKIRGAYYFYVERLSS